MVKRSGFILLIIIAMIASSFDIQSEVEEYQAKAAFIYNFTKFVEWEDNSLKGQPDFNIGILGDSPIIKPLQELSLNKRINNKKINVIRYANAREVRSCQVIFIPESTSPQLIKELSQSQNVRSTLIITERDGDLEYGSGINFLLVNNKIRFEINVNSLSRNNIKASSQLLKLALNIKN